MNKSCPNRSCTYIYPSKKKPEMCPQCSAYIGIVSYFYLFTFLIYFAQGGVRKKTTAKPQAEPKTSLGKVISIGGQLYSVYNHKHYRVFCNIEEGNSFFL